MPNPRRLAGWSHLALCFEPVSAENDAYGGNFPHFLDSACSLKVSSFSREAMQILRGISRRKKWLARLHTDYSNLRELLIPTVSDVVEDEPEFAMLSRLDRRIGYRLRVYIGLARPDKIQRHSFLLRNLAQCIAKGHLHGDATQRLVS